MRTLLAILLVALPSIAHAANTKTEPLNADELKKVKVFYEKINTLDRRKVVKLKGSDRLYVVMRPKFVSRPGVVLLRHCRKDLWVTAKNVRTVMDAQVTGELADDDFNKVYAEYEVQCLQEHAETSVTSKQVGWGLAGVSAALLLLLLL